MHSSLIVASLAILIDLVAADVPNPSTDRSQLLEFPVGLLGNSEFNSAPLEKLHRSSRLLGSSFGLPLDKEFDYVIVGGGTAGLTLATRLAQDGTLAVAVVEAGTFYETSNGNRSQIPADALSLSFGLPTEREVSWGDKTVPQPQLNGRQLGYPQGRCLGGSSALNTLLYQRGASSSYQRWADLVKDTSYTFDNLLPFFKRSVAFAPPNYRKRATTNDLVSYDPHAYSASGGPFSASFSNFVQPITACFRKAFARLGFPSLAGFNSGISNGYSESTFQMNTCAVRSSSEASFLALALRSTDLQVYQQTMARRILFNGTTATGVELSTDRAGTFTLYARKEVILSAGALRSPQLLMVSGIGPRPELAKWNISAVSVLSGVGNNLQDNPLIAISGVVNVTTATQLQTNQSFIAEATHEYLSNASGPLSNVGVNVIAGEKLPPSLRGNLSQSTVSDLSAYPPDWPEYWVIPLATGLAPPIGSHNYASIVASQLTTTSRGTVTLNSTDMRVNPLIDHKLLSTTTDQELAVAIVRRLRELFGASDLLVGPEEIPGPSVQSDQQILAFLRSNVGLFQHAQGTCAMGVAASPNAVVDSRARVFGVEGLRVVDASIIPFGLPGFPTAHVYMLAEKIAQDILM